jgi:addiction module HigA family antidote
MSSINSFAKNYNGRRGVTPSTALRLSKFFGVSPDFWLNVQLRWDLYFAQQSEVNILKTIKPMSPEQEYAH